MGRVFIDDRFFNNIFLIDGQCDQMLERKVAQFLLEVAQTKLTIVFTQNVKTFLKALKLTNVSTAFGEILPQTFKFCLIRSYC